MPSPAWNERNRRARALGYRSYYDYRAHGYGREPPSAPRASGAELRRLRGHASRADLVKAAGDGSYVRAVPIESSRDKQGRLRRVHVTLVDGDGRESSYILSGKQFSSSRMRRLRAQLEAQGVNVDTQYWDEVAE